MSTADFIARLDAEIEAIQAGKAKAIEKCVNCRHWTSYRNNRGECNKFGDPETIIVRRYGTGDRRNTATRIDYRSRRELRVNLITDADFGCTAWEAKVIEESASTSETEAIQ